MKLYDMKALEKFIRDTLENGNHEYIQLQEGCLGLGKILLRAYDQTSHWNFVINEVYLNEWSSGHTFRKCGKISKQLEKEIEQAEAMENMEVEE